MDTGKLLKIIEDIQKDEQAYNFQVRFQNILNFYNDNNTEGINNERDSLYIDIQKSILSTYVLTDLSALQKLGASSFFGLSSIDEIKSILNSQAHEIKQKLEKFVQTRQEFINKFNTANDSLKSLGIAPNALASNEFQIGLSLPEKYSNLNDFQNIIDDFDKFFVVLAGEDRESKKYKIVSVSNGTIELFISVAPHLAENFNIALEHILEVYEIIKITQEMKKRYERYTKERKGKVYAVHDDQLAEDKEKIIVDFIKKVNPPKSDENHLRNFFNSIVKHFESGVNAEVKTPVIDEPRDPSESDDENTKKQLQEQRKSYTNMLEINTRNKKLFELQKNEFYGMKAELPISEADESVEETVGGES